jgi:hypothetical protein
MVQILAYKWVLCNKEYIWYKYWHREVRVMVFNTTFNNISIISRQSVLLVEEIGVPVENH